MATRGVELPLRPARGPLEAERAGDLVPDVGVIEDVTEREVHGPEYLTTSLTPSAALAWMTSM
jgi:hypothetical protein